MDHKLEIPGYSDAIGEIGKRIAMKNEAAAWRLVLRLLGRYRIPLPAAKEMPQAAVDVMQELFLNGIQLGRHYSPFEAGVFVATNYMANGYEVDRELV